RLPCPSPPPLQPRHLPFPPLVLRLVHELPRFCHVLPGRFAVALLEGEARPLHVGVAEEEAHPAPLGDLQGLGEGRRGSGPVPPTAVEGGPCQQAAGEKVLSPRLP